MEEPTIDQCWPGMNNLKMVVSSITLYKKYLCIRSYVLIPQPFFMTMKISDFAKSTKNKVEKFTNDSSLNRGMIIPYIFFSV